MGEMATGKSTVGGMLAKKGAVIIPADEIAHSTYDLGAKPGFEMVVDAFGRNIVDSSGQIDRVKLGNIVFSDKSQLQKLDEIVWPLTEARIKTLLESFKNRNVGVAVIEATVLREAGWDKYVNEVWEIRSSQDLIVKRIMQRNGLTTREAEDRLFTTSSEKKYVSDVLIENNGSHEDLERTVDKVWNEFGKRRGIEL